MKKLLIILLVFTNLCCIGASARGKGQSVIFETDMGNDIDDALALDLLFKKMDQGVINLLGIGAHKNNPHAAEYIDIMRCWYGYPKVPVGVNTRCVTDMECRDYTTDVCNLTRPDGQPLFARSKKPRFEEAVDMYRRLLSSQPDKSVVIITVGFSTTMADLLRSGADKYSPLTGKELVARKVKHFSVMAGEFERENYREYNVWNDLEAAKYFFDESPVPMIIAPFTLGKRICYPSSSIAGDFNWGSPHPMVEAYKAYSQMPYDRPSWDVISAYYACHPDSKAFTLSEPGEVKVVGKGVTVFTPAAEGRYRIIEATDEQCRTLLNEFVREITARPRRMKR